MTTSENHGTGWAQTELLVDVLLALDLFDPIDGSDDEPDYQDARERLSGEDFDPSRLRNLVIALRDLDELARTELARKTGATL